MHTPHRLLVVACGLVLGACGTTVPGSAGQGGGGGEGGGGGAGGGQATVNPNEFALLSFVPSEDPVPVTPRIGSKAVSFVATVRLAARPDGGTQSITTVLASWSGKQLGALQPMGSNVFRLEVPDRSKLFDGTLATMAHDDPSLDMKLEFTDELGLTTVVNAPVRVECATGPATDHSYFCSGMCRGLWPTGGRFEQNDCGGCGLKCTFSEPGSSASRSGACALYSVTGGWAETCGTFAQMDATAAGTWDLTKSCDQICATYAGRGKPGACVPRCAATAEGYGVYEEASGYAFGNVQGMVMGSFSGGTVNRGVGVPCDQVPQTYLDGLPPGAKPLKIRGFGCCCSFD